MRLCHTHVINEALRLAAVKCIETEVLSQRLRRVLQVSAALHEPAASCPALARASLSSSLPCRGTELLRGAMLSCLRKAGRLRLWPKGVGTWLARCSSGSQKGLLPLRLKLRPPHAFARSWTLAFAPIPFQSRCHPPPLAGHAIFQQVCARTATA